MKITLCDEDFGSLGSLWFMYNDLLLNPYTSDVIEIGTASKCNKKVPQSPFIIASASIPSVSLL